MSELIELTKLATVDGLTGLMNIRIMKENYRWFPKFLCSTTGEWLLLTIRYSDMEKEEILQVIL